MTRGSNRLLTSVYIKPTYDNQTLNYVSIAPLKYKVSTIKTLLHRGFAVSGSWSAFHAEVTRIKCLLNNNNFPIKLIDKEIKKFVNSKVNIAEKKVKSDINLYFCNRMTEHHENEEKKLKSIISNHVHPSNDNYKVNLNIYYRNLKIKNLLIKNSPPRESKAEDHCVYRYTCDETM